MEIIPIKRLIKHNNKRSEIHSAFAMYKSKYAVFCRKFFFKNCLQSQRLCSFIALGVIISHSSILLTIPVAFIYAFLLKLQIVMLVFVNGGDLYCRIYF